MYTGQYVFAQVMEYLPWPVFRRCVARYGGDHKIKSFSCLDQFRCLAFAQLTWRESLRDKPGPRAFTLDFFFRVAGLPFPPSSR